MSHYRLRRHLHPGAWWAWAAGLAVAAIRTTNPILLGLIAVVTAYVVAARRTDAPWARSYAAFLRIGLAIVLVRLVIQVVAGTRLPGHVLVALPEVPLPDWAAGVRIGGDITREGLVSALCQGLRLAVVIACFGAANALASPHRLLRCLPGALYEAGVVVTVALAFAPEALVSVQQVREARRLRGRPTRGVAGLRGLAVPVLEGALQRSVDLAASMDSRGYGRRRALPRRVAAAGTAATVGGLLCLAAGLYGVLDAGAPGWLGLPALSLGAALLAGGLAAGSRSAQRTRYRPDPWRLPEWAVLLCGLAPAVAFVLAGRADPIGLEPSVFPLVAPTVPLLAVAGLLVAVLPSLMAPRPPTLASTLPRPNVGVAT